MVVVVISTSAFSAIVTQDWQFVRIIVNWSPVLSGWHGGTKLLGHETASVNKLSLLLVWKTNQMLMMKLNWKKEICNNIIFLLNTERLELCLSDTNAPATHLFYRNGAQCLTQPLAHWPERATKMSFRSPNYLQSTEDLKTGVR